MSRSPRRWGDETPMQRAIQIIHNTCADPEDPLASFSDAVADLHHYVVRHGVVWEAALDDGEAAFARQRDRDWDTGRRSQAELMEICEESRRGIDPEWDSGLSVEESRIERTETALEDILGADGRPATTPSAKASEALGSLRFAAVSFGIDWDAVLRKAESYYRSDLDGF